jgi:hypothetical protein
MRLLRLRQKMMIKLDLQKMMQTDDDADDID